MKIIMYLLVCFSLVLSTPIQVHAQSKVYLPLISNMPKIVNCVQITQEILNKVNTVIAPDDSTVAISNQFYCPESSLDNLVAQQIASSTQLNLPVNKVSHVFTTEYQTLTSSRAFDPNAITNVIWLRRIQAMNNQIQSGKLGNLEIPNLVTLYRDPSTVGIRLVLSVLCEVNPTDFTPAKLQYTFTTYEQVGTAAIVHHWAKVQWDTLSVIACPGLVNFQNIELSTIWFILTPDQRAAIDKDAQQSLNKWEGRITLQPMGLQPAYTTDASFTALEYGSVIILVVVIAGVVAPEVYNILLAS